VRAADLHHALDEIAGPEPDLGAARVAVRSRVQRRRVTTTVVVVVLFALAAIPITANVRSSSNESSIASDPHGQASERGNQRIESSHYGFAVDVPTPWMSHKRNVDSGKFLPWLFTAKSGASEAPSLNDCAGWADIDTVFVRIQDLGYPEPRDVVLPLRGSPASKQRSTEERPASFGPQYGYSPSECTEAITRAIIFNDQGRRFAAFVFAGTRTPRADITRAYRVLDSFRVGPLTLDTFCADAAQLFNTSNKYVENPVWRLRSVAPSRAIYAALGTAISALEDPNVMSTKRQRRLTEAERKALRIVDDALDECGLGNEIFASWARSLQ